MIIIDSQFRLILNAELYFLNFDLKNWKKKEERRKKEEEWKKKKEENFELSHSQTYEQLKSTYV